MGPRITARKVDKKGLGFRESRMAVGVAQGRGTSLKVGE